MTAPARTALARHAALGRRARFGRWPCGPRLSACDGEGRRIGRGTRPRPGPRPSKPPRTGTAASGRGRTGAGIGAGWASATLPTARYPGEHPDGGRLVARPPPPSSAAATGPSNLISEQSRPPESLGHRTILYARRRPPSTPGTAGPRSPAVGPRSSTRPTPQRNYDSVDRRAPAPGPAPPSGIFAASLSGQVDSRRGPMVSSRRRPAAPRPGPQAPHRAGLVLGMVPKGYGLFSARRFTGDLTAARRVGAPTRCGTRPRPRRRREPPAALGAGPAVPPACGRRCSDRTKLYCQSEVPPARGWRPSGRARGRAE
jgi:hypothetical protein